ncbi:MAG: hypothetical protein HY299_17240 [Verrucomicrobia bacterium]|nr:hypothetical protein [Verrucomicrobiota bacterium]
MKSALSRFGGPALRIAAAALCSLAPSLHAGTHTWSGAGANAHFSTAQNWSLGGVPAARESAVVLVFPAAAASKAPIQNIPELGIDQMIIQGDSYVFSAAPGNAFFLRGGSPVDIENNGSVGTVFDASASIVLNAGEATIHGVNGSLIFNGPISGAGGLRIDGPTVELGGAVANTFAGATLAERGRLHLKKTAGVNAVPGALVVGHSAVGGAVTDAWVQWLASNQLSDLSAVSTLPSGGLVLGAFNESIGALDMDGGSVGSGSGVLTLLGKLTSRGSVNDGHSANLSGHLALGGQTRVFDCLGGSSLFIDAVISGSGAAGITKTGTGALGLAGANTYPGITTIAEGGIQAYSDLAFGAVSGGTVVGFDCSITLYGVDIGNEPLELNGGQLTGDLRGYGDTSWAGPITLNGGGTQSFYPQQGTMILSGPVSGSGKLRLVTQEASLVLSGASANTYGGGTLVYAGELVLAKDPGVTAIPGALSIGLNSSPTFPTSVVLSNQNQIADASAVTMFPQSVLRLNNHTETIGSLQGVGEVETGFATLVTGGNDFTTTFSGLISGLGQTPLIKQGTGAMILTGTNAVVGRTLVNDGKLIVHGRSVGPVWVSGGATLGGNGSVGDVAGTNGVVSPGAGPGLLTTEDLALNSQSVFRVELNGTSPGITHDQLSVHGKVALGNCALVVVLGFSPAGGDRFTLINNDGADSIQGTFAGLPEGKQFEVNGQKFSISYAGGTGNDVVLTRVNTAPSLTSITATPFVNEGGAVSVNGVISDPDAGDSFSLLVNWGDGSPEQSFQFAPGTFSFHVDHTYLDDKPGASPSDSFEISYALNDNSGPGSFGQLNVVVGNVPPSVNAGPDESIASGEAMHGSGSFADPGADTWTATVNYGDGSPAQPLALGPGKTFVLDHLFPSDGSYLVTVTLKDDDGGEGSDTIRVDVGLKLKIASRGPDHVSVSWPSLFKGYVLQSSATIAPAANWASVPGAPAELGVEWVQTLPHGGAAGFFRLVKP